MNPKFRNGGGCYKIVKSIKVLRREKKQDERNTIAE
jgi:hypothetical protein